MAASRDRADRMSSVTDDDDGDSQNLWASILSDVQSSSSSNLPSSKAVLVLGENECGKTTLIAKLQAIEEPKKGIGLEYFYINVKDEYRDDQTRMGMWALDGDPSHTGLLKFALSEQSFPNTLVMLVASMDQPWSILDSLEKWAAVLRQHIDRLKLLPEDRRDYEQSLIRGFQEYTEPDESQSTQSQTPLRREANPLHPHHNSVSEEDRVVLPLGENILSHNLGIPIVVVITKADAISTLEKEHDFKEEHFDFIQQHIRKFCLNYGAALFYTSVKEEKNCDLLHDYLLHRIYGFPFTSQAYVVEKDCVFIPTGWDNDKKVAILYENLSSMKAEDAYDDVISKPITRKPVQKDAEVIAEDHQVFLMKMQGLLSKAVPAGSAGDSPVRPSTGQPKAPQGQPLSRGASTPAPSNVSPKKVKFPTNPTGFKLDGKNPNTSEGMLAHFFNSLLNKKTAGGQPGSPRPDAAAVHRDAAAELERMTKTKQTKRALSEQNPNGPSSSAS